jgi:tetratricopeptide (TPR) repeat protein
VRKSFAQLLVAALALASPCRADAQPPTAIGWREHVAPERRMAIAYRQDGLVRLLQSMSPQTELAAALGADPAWLLLDQALLRFERARRAMPDDPELAFYTAMALTRYERPAPDGSTEQRTEEALEAWHRLRALAPDFFPDRVANELAMLHMRRHEFERARAEYETALRRSIPRPLRLADQQYPAASTERRLAVLFESVERATLHGNLAEAAMLVGDVPAALHHYRASLDAASHPVTHALGLFGLALALERSGAHDQALETIRRALRADPVAAAAQSPDDPWSALSQRHGPFAVLHLPGVFFEPPSEVHAYHALGHEALARADAGSVDREQLREAVQSWRLFFAAGGLASRYAPLARQTLERLEQELEPTAPTGGVTPPSGRSRRR